MTLLGQATTACTAKSVSLSQTDGVIVCVRSASQGCTWGIVTNLYPCACAKGISLFLT